MRNLPFIQLAIIHLLHTDLQVIGQALYHIDFRDGVDARNIQTHSDFHGTFWERENVPSLNYMRGHSATFEMKLSHPVFSPTVEIGSEVAVVAFH